MSYITILKKNNADNLWCGKASTYDCLLGLLHAINKENWDVMYPNFEDLKDLLKFIENDNSDKFFNRLKVIEAPPNTGRIPLSDAKSNLLVKILVNRLDTVCINYFHSRNSSEWKPKNNYGTKLLNFWKIFDIKYIDEVMEFVKTRKSLPETKLENLKNLSYKLQGVWVSKMASQLNKLEKEVLKKKQIDTVAEKAEAYAKKEEEEEKKAKEEKKKAKEEEKKAKEKEKTVVEFEKEETNKVLKNHVEQENNKNTDEWVTVSNKRKLLSKN